MNVPTGRIAPPPDTARGVAWFEGRVVLGFVALLFGAVPFLTLMLLVRRQWAPLQELDDDVAHTLNEQASASTVLVDALQVVTELGGNLFAVYAFVLATLWFLIRRQPRLAAFVATTGIGLAVLVPVTKAVIGRPRPQVPIPVVEIPSNASFPSGHAMVSLVTVGMLTLILLPAVPRRLRPLLVTVAAALTLAVGATRLALGVHFVSDVLAGYALGASWLAVITVAFRAWQRDCGVPVTPLTDGLDPQPARRPATPSTERATRRFGQPRLAALAAAAVTLLVTLTALGLLVTSTLTDTAVARLDASVVQQVLDLRTEDRTQLARAVSTLSGTPMVLALTVGMAVIALALRLGRRPVAFVATVVLGEVLLYFAVSRIVDRARPDVPDLTSGLPVAASWPSGHTAAAVAVYGALATLVILYLRSPWRWTVLLLPLLAPLAVAVSRVYVAAHRPTDVLAGLVLGTLWLLACTRYLLPPTHATAARAPQRSRDRPAPEEPSSTRRDLRAR
jgi:membrane-associated phospholipid phosphatase